MKKAGKIVIGLVCVGAFGALMFTRFTKKEEPIEAVPNPTVVVQTPETGNIELSTGLTGRSGIHYPEGKRRSTGGLCKSGRYRTEGTEAVPHRQQAVRRGKNHVKYDSGILKRCPDICKQDEGALRERRYFRPGLRAGGKRSVHGEAPV